MDGKKRYFLIFFALLAFAAIYFSPLPFEFQAKVVLATAVLALVLWISEAIPLHVTALVLAMVLVVAGGFAADKVFAQFFDRVVVLVLGGFVLAVALNKHKLDEFFAYKVLGKLGHKPSMVLFGMLCVSAFLSMWMSNSAAAAIAMPIAVVIISQNNLVALRSDFAKSMVLAVAYGATIGGIGTIIGSTPNVLTQKFLTEQSVSFGFVEWGMRGFPFMVALLLGCWFILWFVFRPEIKSLEIKASNRSLNREQKMVGAVFLLTVFLWVTESIHGIHNSVVALVPIALLYGLNLLESKDFNRISWDSLILIGGGIVLGMSIEASGLSAMLSGALGGLLSNQPAIIIFFLLGVVGVMLTSFLSNTAASAVLIPIIVSLSTALNFDITNLVVAGAIGVSMDFVFPMGTPPSALAYSSGYIHTKDMIKSGLLVSVAGAIILAVMGFFLWGIF